jgi:upstream activation factor subunit UAF30
MPAKAAKETKAPEETRASKEAKVSKETKAPKAAKASKEKGGKAEPASPGGQKPNALQKPLQPSKELAAVVGSEPLPRGEVVSKVWEYIKTHDLQNPQNRREILADDTLEAVFGKKKVTMFEMNKYLAQHLASPEEE